MVPVLGGGESQAVFSWPLNLEPVLCSHPDEAINGRARFLSSSGRGSNLGGYWTPPYSPLTLREPAHHLPLERRLQKLGRVKSVKTKDDFLQEHPKAGRGRSVLSQRNLRRPRAGLCRGTGDSEVGSHLRDFKS